MTLYEIMQDIKWRDAVNFLTELLGCTRYAAARVIRAGINEGYLR